MIWEFLYYKSNDIFLSGSLLALLLSDYQLRNGMAGGVNIFEISGEGIIHTFDQIILLLQEALWPFLGDEN